MGDGGSKAAGTPGRIRSRGDAERARALYFVAAAVLAALIPLILFAGLWIRAVLNQNERDLETYLTSRAALLAERVDAEIEQQFSILRAIAAQPSLDGPDLFAKGFDVPQELITFALIHGGTWTGMDSWTLYQRRFRRGVIASC